ncbi:MAG TPA: hypothetical protein VE127_01235 [Solirubrobacteraceae bacterium]|nr:hypothetical protein [Solirubrobacteraceae bacterium]
MRPAVVRREVVRVPVVVRRGVPVVRFAVVAGLPVAVPAPEPDFDLDEFGFVLVAMWVSLRSVSR